ncbi:MAG: DNA translocase FtsK [Chloroflexi bacterium]|nr:DNA translocase FtsK [Chloroflexota bacterium]
MAKIAEHEAEIASLQRQIAQRKDRARALVTLGRAQGAKLNEYFQPPLETTAASLRSLILSRRPVTRAGWTEDCWGSWQPDVIPVNELAMLRYGDLLEERGVSNVTLPAFVPFIGQNSTVIINSGGTSAAAGLSLLQSIVVRTALMLPHQATYTLLDPAGNGAAYPMQRLLPQIQPLSDDVRRDLDSEIAHIRYINETYLDASVTSFEQIPERMRSQERYHLIFAADFPNRYDRRAIEALQNISATGPRAGTYLFIQLNSDYTLPRDMSMADFKNTNYISAVPGKITARLPLRLQPDGAPPAQVQDSLFTRLSAAAPVEHKLDWDSVTGLPPEQWWQQDASLAIEVPIGKRGNDEDLRIYFGENRDGRPCVHGILGAMTGAGKSTFFHTLIDGLAVRYNPEELRLHLIDGKQGVEFQSYLRLPHAEVVSLKTSPELSRSVLGELIDEMKRRNDMFTRYSVVDLKSYRALGQPGGQLPRILLVIDEYQELFEDDRDGVASARLRTLSEQGRSAGIHMLLASQRFGAVGMLHQTAIFGNIHLRMAMKMAEPDIRALTEFQARGKALIAATCNAAGKIVINDRAGEDTANLAGKVAIMTADRRREIVDQLEARGSALPSESLPQRVVFHGDEQPKLVDNPLFSRFLRQPIWYTPRELALQARLPSHQGGLNVADWYEVQRPLLMWLGQEFNVRGQANLVLRRRASEHVVVVGGDNGVRYGMLSAMLASLAVIYSPDYLRIVIRDKSIPDAEWGCVLETACELVLRPAGFSVDYARQEESFENALRGLISEIELRRSMKEDERLAQPSVVTIITELENIDAFRRRADQLVFTESPSGELLRKVYLEGGPFGVHIILSSEAVGTLLSVLDEKRGLTNFRHRVALQMSEDDSFRFVRSRKASQLQSAANQRPVVSLYVDLEKDSALRFKPYSIRTGAPVDYDSIQPAGDMTWQFQDIGAALSRRR